MADGTWRGRPITLGQFLSGGGTLFAACGSPACGVASEIEPRLVEDAWRSSVQRLEEAIRCACGARGGTLIVVDAGERLNARVGRCYLFHG